MKEQKGEITVFLVLVLGILISMLFTGIEAARINAVRFQSECVADMALQSVLAEYNRELLEQYDLFFIESGYGTKQSGVILLEEHIKDYMNQNFRNTVDYLPFGANPYNAKDLLELETKSVCVTKQIKAVDDGGEILEKAAIKYMLDKYGLPDTESIVNNRQEAEQNHIWENKMNEKWAENERAIDDVDTTVTNDEGEEEEVPVHNPADAVNSKRGSSGILRLVTRNAPISYTEIQKSDFFSEREGSGLLNPTEGSSISAAEDLIFQKYLMEKCGMYTREKENSLLSYQMEYLLEGKSTDYDNLKAVVNKLIMLREVSNFMFLMSDNTKQAEAEALALTLSVVLMFPELKDLIKLSIIFAWSYAESVNDVAILLDNGRVPLWKTNESWKLGLENALDLAIETAETEEQNITRGLSYTDYLHMFLTVMDKKERNFRFMDLIEMDIRQTEGNRQFCIDKCIYGFTAEIITESKKGHSCILFRKACYEK